MKRRLALFLLCSGLGALGTALLPACNDDSTLLRAKVIESRSERVGGPVSMGDVGDFLLENDQIRVAILRAIHSPGPGPYGGSIVDIDRRRPWIGYEGVNGLDRFAEAFPMANLLVPEPEWLDVFVLKDGSDGKEAAIRVQAEGGFFLQALGVLRRQEPLLSLYFPNVRTKLHFTTDYILHPGERFVTMRTELRISEEQPLSCPLSSCPNECPYGYTQDPFDGCLTCECSDLVRLDNYTAPEGVFLGLLGEPPDDPPDPDTVRAGIVAGDFVFFGNQNDVFAPGPGFDESWAVYRAFNRGQNTFAEPLSYDYVAAAGGDVSYAYFTLPGPDGVAPKVNVPLITSAATVFVAAHKNCLFGPADDDACDRHRAFVYERYLAVGDGDVASVTEVIYDRRGIPVGQLSGHVLWAATNEPVPNAEVLVFADYDPDPNRIYESADELVESNLALRGDFGAVNAIDADRGLDRVEDGDFNARLPEGSYVLVAQTSDGSALSKPVSITVRPGQDTVAVLTLPTPATIVYRVTDDGGLLLPAKLSLIDVDKFGQPLEGDALRRPFLGHGRLGTGRKLVELTPDGQGELRVPPGSYTAFVSRGPEYSIHEEKPFKLTSGELKRIDALLVREVDTTGWMSVDTHLHSTMSFDSGLPLDIRVTAAAAEGLDLAVATDHDVITDYRPEIRKLGLEPVLGTAVGEEISTLEQGHFIAFPLRYDELTVPDHGALDWTCVPLSEIFAWAQGMGDGGIEPLTVVAHPRDGFLGYLSQLGVDAYTMNRSLSMFEESNPVFRTATCDFDAMEVFNAKRFELIRTPSIQEIADWNHCLERVNAAATIDELGAACPELSPGLPVGCDPAERFDRCQDRVRTELAWRSVKRVLTRTPAEQQLSWQFAGTEADSNDQCVSAIAGGAAPDEVDEPCTVRAGHLDDFFRLLERGMTPTQLGASDSHGYSLEPGYPRSYFRSSTDSPGVLSLEEATAALRAGHVLATYGPFIRASINGKTYGEIVSAPPGSSLSLLFDVQTASWFGVDRVEVYLNGQLLSEESPEVGPAAIVDIAAELTFNVPDRDSWVVIVAMGLLDENLMRKAVLDLMYGELELSRIAADAFARVPMISDVFPSPPSLPSWGPTPPYAMTNPIYIDTNNNGKYDPPLPPPDFCSRPCDPGNLDPAQCPEGQRCLEGERLCGFAISGACSRDPSLRIAHH